MKTNIKLLLSPVAIALLTFCNSAYSQSDTVNFEKLSLTDLLKVKITTASKTSLEIEKVPATVVIITKEQIKMRGYRSLLDVPIFITASIRTPCEFTSALILICKVVTI
ncbi:MAG TPA: hypothetical protein VIM79_17475 [Niastella sp.]